MRGGVEAASNNGLHPTADTLLVMYIESLGAAGDARRYAAYCRVIFLVKELTCYCHCYRSPLSFYRPWGLR